MGKLIRLALGFLVAATVVGGATRAFAHEGGASSEGSCSQGSSFKLDLSVENDQLRTKFEVVEGIDGDTWRILLKDNGMVIFKGMRTTDDGGSFEVEVFSQDLPGTDTVMARAANLATGEMCQASAKL